MRVRLISLTLLLLLLPGCMNTTLSLQPEKDAISGKLEGRDCIPIILGFAYGTATVERARAPGFGMFHEWNALLDSSAEPPRYISTIRRIQLHDYTFLMFGARCVEVLGE